MNNSIHNAAYQGNLPKVRTLLGAGVPINLRNQNNMTPLMSAAYGGSAHVVRHLINRGANTRAKTGNTTALMFAVRSGNVNTVRALLRHSNLEAKNPDQLTALAIAASNMKNINPEIIRMLIRAGARTNENLLNYLWENKATRNLIGNVILRRARARRAIPQVLDKSRMIRAQKKGKLVPRNAILAAVMSPRRVERMSRTYVSRNPNNVLTWLNYV